jgi:hypothetical protein
MRLESKVALITGGYGAGRESARLFAKKERPCLSPDATRSAVTPWSRRSMKPAVRPTS